MAGWEAEIERVEGRVNVLDATVKQHLVDDDKKWDANRVTHKELYTRTERPSWLITWILGGFMSTTVGLAVYLFTH